MCPHVLAQIVGENIPAKIHDSHVFSPVCIYAPVFRRSGKTKNCHLKYAHVPTLTVGTSYLICIL
jgi:hypothetical protein